MTELSKLWAQYSALICIYLVFVNALAFSLFGVDKKKAVQHRWRVPEKTLIASAIIGGSIGAFIGMKAFHHKTKKPKFAVGIPVIIVIQVFLVAYLVYMLKT